MLVKNNSGFKDDVRDSISYVMDEVERRLGVLCDKIVTMKLKVDFINQLRCQSWGHLEAVNAAMEITIKEKKEKWNR